MLPMQRIPRAMWPLLSASRALLDVPYGTGFALPLDHQRSCFSTADPKQPPQDPVIRGYMGALEHMRTQQGRVFDASAQLTPADTSPVFPTMQVTTGSTKATLPHLFQQGHKASVITVSCRAGAQPIIAAWSEPLQRFANSPHVALYNMVYVDAVVFRMWPLRWIIARPKQGPPTSLYYFDHNQDVRNALRMRNLLSGYVYVVDAAGRIRWKGSGQPRPEECERMVKAIQTLAQ